MIWRTWRYLPAVVGFVAILGATRLCAEVIRVEAKNTLAAVEMDNGDRLDFRLRDGRVVSLLLEQTDAAIVERVEPGGIVYRFSATFRIDGQSMQLQRYVCSQECFYEPWVVNGLRIWLDTVGDVFDLIPVRYPRKGNLRCVPRKAARLAVQDATLRICPDKVVPWIEHEGPTLDVGECYNGDDCYLGPYLGKACHVGMDINHVKGSSLFAPIRFDTQAYFNSLATGDNNNRWRGIRRWENGDVWALQSHHLIELLVRENTPLEAGVKYATTAGVHVGSHEHTHFEFKIGRPRDPAIGEKSSIAAPIDFDDESEFAQDQPEALHLDPWILFWQAFEDRRDSRLGIRAAMEPEGPAQVGKTIHFSAAGSREGLTGKHFRCFWSFGDTEMAEGAVVTHAFHSPGVFPVRLVVDDGMNRDSIVQWLTVSGSPDDHAALVLRVPDELPFRPWPMGAAETHAQPVRKTPHTLRFLARPSRPVPAPKIVHLDTIVGDDFIRLTPVEFEYREGSNWLSVARQRRRKALWLEVSVDATGLEPGTYKASVCATCPDLPRSPQRFLVELKVPSDPPRANVTVDDADEGFYATPHFWVGHRFCRCPAGRRGYGGFYLTNGSRADVGEFVRFAPDLQGGEYEVSLAEETPFSPDVEFNVRVRHAGGDETIRMRPENSRTIGVFEFHEGMDGFVEILAEGSKGLVIADAMHFRRSQPAP